MATYTFETMTSADAANFVAGDTLTFSGSTLTPADVVVANSANGFDITTLTAGGKSLSFPSPALSGATIQFASSFIAGTDAKLVIGTNGVDSLFPDSDDDGSVLYAFAGDDSINAFDSGAMTISAGDGNDILNAFGGGSIDGGAGDDQITSTTADDLIITGGAGDDSILVNGTGDATISGGAGVDIVTINSTADGVFSISLDDGNDVMSANSSDATLVVNGGGGADSITGGTGNDRLYGQSAAGGADGNDNINGRGGADYIQGNAGADTLSGAEGSDRIFGGADNDVINGGDGNDSVNGNKGADDIRGGDGNDSLRGGADGDRIFGDAGNDVIQGDAGNDTIIGSDGVDILSGGDGNDLFAFVGPDAGSLVVGDVTFTDRITDFGTGDRIDLGFSVTDVTSASGVLFTTVAAAFDYAERTGVDDNEVLALTVGTNTYLFYRAGGQDGAVDSVITLNGVSALTAESFANTGILEG
ncbi:MAG: calcium-binding protein [Pseudomonadota bacterium]